MARAGKRRRVLTTGRMSVGKSSLINALWGVPDALPTATRDCTQTNTLVRPPEPGEKGRTLKIRYLSADAAAKYALGGVQWWHITEFLRDVNGPFGVPFDDMPPREALRRGVEEVRTSFVKNHKFRIIHDNLEEDIEVVEDLLVLIGEDEKARPSPFPDEKAGGSRLPNENSGKLVGEGIEKPFDERIEYLMGKRRPNGTIAGAGRIMAQEWVEALIEPVGWAGDVPEILDTPWIPAVHDTRRVDLITRAAEDADVILLVDLPRPLTVEEWLANILKKQPDRARNVIVVLNQIDTVDQDEIYVEDGFLAAVESTRKVMQEYKIPQENLVFTTSWLAYLKGLNRTPEVETRIGKLADILAKLSKKIEGSGASKDVISAMKAACNPDDGGIVTLRKRIGGVQ